jgi:pilus assembly protein CpaC
MNLLLILGLLFSSVCFAQLDERELTVAVGIDKTERLPYKYSVKVEIGNNKLLKLILAPKFNEITFKGLTEGTTSVTVRNTIGEIKTKYLVTVTADKLSKKVKELRELIGDVEGIDIGIKGGRVYVGGAVVVPSDIGRMSVVLEKFPEVLRLYEMHPQTQLIIAKKMAEEIARNGMKNVTVRVVNKVYWVEGVIGSKGQEQLVQRISDGYLPPGIQELYTYSGRAQTVEGKKPIEYFLSINSKKQKQPAEKLIKVSAQFVELSKDYAKVFAFKWMPLLGKDGSKITFGSTGDASTSSSSEGLSGVISNLFPKLQSAKEAGYARIIQSGMVIVKNGSKSGGKISKQTKEPFAVGTGEFSQAQTATVGFNMEVKPRIVEQEKVELSISIQVDVPNKTGKNGSPINTNNSLSTNLIIKTKESAVIGGVVQNHTITSYDKNDPSQSDSVDGGGPLFYFLRSKSYDTSKSQFVVFVTPEIIQSASVGTEEIRKKFRRQR